MIPTQTLLPNIAMNLTPLNLVLTLTLTLIISSGIGCEWRSEGNFTWRKIVTDGFFHDMTPMGRGFHTTFNNFNSNPHHNGSIITVFGGQSSENSSHDPNLENPNADPNPNTEAQVLM